MCQFNKRQYRVLWSSARADWVVVPETATSVGHSGAGAKDDVSGDSSTSEHEQFESSLFLRSRLSILIGAMLAGTPVLAAADGLSGASVVHGSVTVNIGSQASTIHQTSDKAIIDWQKFSIQQGQSLTFTQPSSASIALNRVTGTDPSQINGLLSANGQVWLLNPNGVMIGKTGEINVGGFLASTMAISNADFIQGKYQFSSPGSGLISNLGSITANSGYAVLAGTQIVNEGLVQANLGQVVLAAGNSMTLDLAGDKLLSFAVTQPLSSLPSDGKAAIENSGRLVAQGGRVVMTARAATDMMQSVINTTGVVEATSARVVNGEIVLDGGSSGMVNIAGTLDVSGQAKGETGGTIKIHGDTLVLNDGAKLDARGDAGGGNIYVGGGWQGALVDGRNPSVRVGVMPTASLNATAINSGNGGTIVVWSDILNPLSKTVALGSFKAEGGINGGDGGRVETSGRYLRTDFARVSTLAPKGRTGSWLIDPDNIEIFHGSTMDDRLSVQNYTLLNSSPNQFGPGPTATTGNSSTEYTFRISDQTINYSLSTTNVELKTDTGSISFIGANISSSTPYGLTLQSGDSIFFEGSNISLGGAMIAVAKNNINVTGSTIISSGDVVLQAAGGVSLGSDTSSETTGISASGRVAIVAPGGDVTVTNASISAGYGMYASGGDSPPALVLLAGGVITQADYSSNGSDSFFGFNDSAPEGTGNINISGSSLSVFGEMALVAKKSITLEASLLSSSMLYQDLYSQQTVDRSASIGMLTKDGNITLTRSSIWSGGNNKSTGSTRDDDFPAVFMIAGGDVGDNGDPTLNATSSASIHISGAYSYPYPYPETYDQSAVNTSGDGPAPAIISSGDVVLQAAGGVSLGSDTSSETTGISASGRVAIVAPGGDVTVTNASISAGYGMYASGGDSPPALVVLAGGTLTPYSDDPTSKLFTWVDTRTDTNDTTPNLKPCLSCDISVKDSILKSETDTTSRGIALIAPGKINIASTVIEPSDFTRITLPKLKLFSDTGASSTDGVTSNGKIDVTDLASGSIWEYSINGGNDWTVGDGNSFVLPAGKYDARAIQVRQVDVADNAGTVILDRRIAIEAKSGSVDSIVSDLGLLSDLSNKLSNGLRNENASTIALVGDALKSGGAAAAEAIAKVFESTGSTGGSFQEVVTKKATESLVAIRQPTVQVPASSTPAPAASPSAQPAQPAPAQGSSSSGGDKAKAQADTVGDAPDGPAQPSAAAPAPAPAAAPAPAPAPNAAAPAPAPNAAAPAPTPQQPAPAPAAAAPAPPPAAPNAASAGPPPPPPLAPPPPSPVAAGKPPTPKDTADSGDKTLAAAAPPPPPKPPAQARAPATQTVAVSPVVSTQVPLPPRPPAGAAADQRVPATGNSARW